MKSGRKNRSRIIAFLISSIMMATTFVNDYTIAYAEEDIRVSDSFENATEDNKSNTTESTGESSKTESADGNIAAESATKSEVEDAGATKTMGPGTEQKSGTGSESGTAPESEKALEPGTDQELETEEALETELETAELETELEIDPELLIEEELEMDYPSQSFTGSASNGIYVEASVEEGVFPAGTIMIVTAVSDSQAMEAVEEAASEGSEIVAAKAVDITFTDGEGKEIQPADGKKVHVSLSSSDAVEGDSHAVFHVDEDGSAERVANASATGAAFDGASFSIYVLAGEKPIADRITFRFMNGETLYDCQIVKDGEILYEPELPVSETGDFLGWYEGDTRFEGFGTVTVSETKTVTLTARFHRTYHVYFYGADGATVQATKNAQDGESVPTTDVTIPVEASKAVVGWSASQNGTTAVGDTVTVRGADIKLYPIIKEVKWVTFDTDGGSVVTPVYVSEGQTAVRPGNPTRAGYTFEKWVIKGSSPQQEYTFTEKVTENITLLAKWKANAASYTMVYWAEDAEDDAYETFIKTETVTGLSDTPIEASDVSRKAGTVTWDKKSYFTYNKTKTEAALGSAKISGDGTTVVNVYFSRNRYTITFDLGNKSYNQMTIGGKTYTGNSKTKYQLTAKYEQNIETMWPTASNFQSGNDFYGWDNVEKDFCQVSKVLTMTENLCTTGGKTAKAVYGTNCLDHLYYMFESFDQTSGANGNNRMKYKGIYYDKSAAYSQDANSTGGSWNAKQISGMKSEGVESKTLRTTGWFNEKPAERNVFLYYSRNSYELSYYNYNQTVKTETIKFGADLTEKYSFTPARPAALSEAHVFQGWYTTPGCLEGTEAPRKLTEMPADNTLVYAKWVTPVYTVSFDLNGAAGTIEPQTVSYGAKAVEPETPVRAGYTFGGWTYADGTRFHFSTKITADTSLKAQWIYDGILYVAYDAITNGGAGAPMDTNQYVETSYATVLRAPTTTPVGKVFLGWALDGKTYYPGETFRVSENLAKDVNGKKVITLVAIYGDKPSATELVYVANNGTDGTKTFSVPRNSYITVKDITDNDIGFTYEHHKFLGWKDGEGTLYKPGDRVVIDNVTDRILTAQWEEIKYTVAFYDRDPSAPDAVLLSMKKDYHYQDKVIAPADPPSYEDTGYEYAFRGWKAEDGRVYRADNLPRVTGDAVYYANYIPKTVISLCANGEYEYDGKQHEAIIDFSSAEALKVHVTGVKAVQKADPSQEAKLTDANMISPDSFPMVTSVDVTEAKVFDQGGADVTERYKVVSEDGTLKITPKPIVIELNSGEKTYDNTELTTPPYTEGGVGYRLAEGYQLADYEINGVCFPQRIVRAEVKGSITQPGQINNSLAPESVVIRVDVQTVIEGEDFLIEGISELETKDLQSNYAITVIPGTLTIHAVSTPSSGGGGKRRKPAETKQDDILGAKREDGLLPEEGEVLGAARAPRTSDSSKAILWMLVMGSSSLGAAATLAYRKKEEKR